MPADPDVGLSEAVGRIRELLDAAQQEMAEFGWGLRTEAEQRAHAETCRLEVSHVEEYDFGWIFYYDSADSVESGDPDSALGGNAPYLFERMSGRVFVTGTAYPMAHYIHLYRTGDLRLAKGG